jgi:hypothetical protein
MQNLFPCLQDGLYQCQSVYCSWYCPPWYDWTHGWSHYYQGNHKYVKGTKWQLKLLIVFQYPPGHSSYTTTAENVFLAATTQQRTSSSSRDSSSEFSMSAFQPSLSSSSPAELLKKPPPSPLTGDTTLPFSVTVDGTTAFCQLSFSADFVFISYAEVGATCLYPL